MRFTPKKIEEILVAILDKDGAPLIKELIGKENVSEFDLATRTKKDIKVIRKMLYTLHNYNLVGFTRKKDKQKGWYIYYWTLLPESIRFNYYKMKKEMVERLKKLLEIEKKELFFVCPNRCVRINFDQSMDFEFHCPECGELINQDNPEERVKDLTARIIGLETEISDAKVQRKERRKIVKERKKVTKTQKRATKKEKGGLKKKVTKPVKKKKNLQK